MPFSINTNIASLQAENYLRINSDFQGKTISRVTSGLRIVSSGDDAAGLAIANGYRSDQSVINQGIRNANDGLSQLQIADGGMNNISQLLDRARSLATQSASGTFTGDRNVLNSEFQSVISEIDRQAQAIGLNKGGTFAKVLSVFIGGGKGASATDVIDNSSETLDLSKSTVDSYSLGLNTYRAVNAKTYDLSTTSDTSVSKIINEMSASSATFTFRGAGFGSAATAVPVTVDLTGGGINDPAALAAAINNAIYQAANPVPATVASKAFKAAGITAGVVTDSSGHEQLVFSSSSSAFQVSGDRVANAFLGNFSDSRAGSVAGEGSTYVEGNSTLATLTGPLGATAAVTFTDSAGATVTADLSGIDGTSPNNLNPQQLVDAINTAIGSAGNYQAELKDGKLAFFAKDGSEFSLQFTDTSGALGFQDFDGTNATTSFNTTYVSSSNALISGGVYQSAQEVSTTTGSDFSTSAYFWHDLTGTDTQRITVSAQRPDGTQTGIDIDLDAGDINRALNTINDKLQNSKDPSLQSIAAVRDGVGIRFISAQQGFSIKLDPSAAGPTEGLAEEMNGTLKQDGIQLAATVQGEGGAADISSQASAQDAVMALANAVTALGQAQAVVGRGENQFNYAINLAQSQTTNLAAAESRIRDADLASEAANLTKAQILMQAGVAALAQANSAPQTVLSLLKS